jgi:hypothetical protein
MATVTKNTLPPIVPVVEYMLTLSEKEAQTVFALVGRATGTQEYSRRKYADSIYYALETYLRPYNGSDLIGNIEFTNTEEK